MEEKNMLNDMDLENVTGGKTDADFSDKRNLFENSWNAMGKETANCSGMKKAEIFDEWTMANYPADITGFIRKYL